MKQKPITSLESGACFRFKQQVVVSPGALLRTKISSLQISSEGCKERFPNNWHWFATCLRDTVEGSMVSELNRPSARPLVTASIQMFQAITMSSMSPTPGRTQMFCHGRYSSGKLKGRRPKSRSHSDRRTTKRSSIERSPQFQGLQFKTWSTVLVGWATTMEQGTGAEFSSSKPSSAKGTISTTPGLMST